MPARRRWTFWKLPLERSTTRRPAYECLGGGILVALRQRIWSVSTLSTVRCHVAYPRKAIVLLKPSPANALRSRRRSQSLSNNLEVPLNLNELPMPAVRYSVFVLAPMPPVPPSHFATRRRWPLRVDRHPAERCTCRLATGRRPGPLNNLDQTQPGQPKPAREPGRHWPRGNGHRRHGPAARL